MRANVHASLVQIGETGILLTGPSGSGKSALAVSLLRAAAREHLPGALVGDDRIDLERRGDVVFGSAPAALTGLIELRGVGLVRLETVAQSEIGLVAELCAAPERMPLQPCRPLLGVGIRRVELPLRQAPHSADILLTMLHADGLLQRSEQRSRRM